MSRCQDKRQKEKTKRRRGLSSEADTKGNGTPNVGEATLEFADVFCIPHVCLLGKIEHASERATFDIIFDG